jgi:hypothetical protein
MNKKYKQTPLKGVKPRAPLNECCLMALGEHQLIDRRLYYWPRLLGGLIEFPISKRSEK